MVWSIISILIFSFLSFAFSIQWSKNQQGEVSTPAFVTDGDLLDSNKEVELQDFNETSERILPQLTGDDMASNEGVELPEYIEIREKIVPHFPPFPMEDNITHNLTEIQEEGTQIPREFELPAFDSGEINTIGVAIYSDTNFTTLSAIDWGKLEPGSRARIECYIKNIGKTPSKLTLVTANWTPPEAATYVGLTWDYDGQRLEIDEIILLTLTLNVSENIQGITEFFFDIIIIGSII